MAEEQKPVEVPKVDETTTTTAEPAIAAPVEAKEETPAAATEATTSTEPTAAATETPAETAAASAEEAKKEIVPVEDGQLDHKGSNFPKNLIYSKKYFWFGTDAVDPKTAPALLKDHHLASWVSETGKGLLFFNEKGTDKKNPTGAVHLADAAEPTTEGDNKFVLTSKGHKHVFKAASLADRDNWVSQLKLKIAEAKELATTVTESETYKKTLESFKPAPVIKKEEAKKEETPKAVEETPAAETAAAETPAATETPVVAAVASETPESPKEEAKPRPATKKRGSIFGNLLGKKEEKKEEKKLEEPVAEANETTADTAATPAEVATETPAVATTEAETAPAATEAPASPEAETKTERPAQSKRTSIFGGLSFGQSFNKKKVSSEEPAAPAVPAKEPEAVSENAPVIPAPEASEPLSTEVTSPATVPVETTEVTPASPVTNGETKKEVKSDKRKSSLPFAFSKKKEAAPATEEGAETEKAKSPNAFSKFRATIKGKAKDIKGGEKSSEEKPAETEAPKVEEATPAETSAVPAPAVEQPAEAAKDSPITSTPTVAATA